MKKLALATATLAAMAGTSAFAADTYRAEVGVGYDQISPDGGDDIGNYNIYGDFYFKEVDTSKGPLAEAAFLDKASNVGLTYADSDVDGSKAAITLDTRIVLGEKWIIEAAYTDHDETSIYNIAGGLYITDNVDLVVNYADRDTASDLGVKAHGVHSVGSADAAIAWTGGYTETSYDADIDNVGVLAGDFTYYFNKMLGLGVNAAFASDGDDNTNTYGIHADWFVVNNVELSAKYSMTSSDFADTSMLGVAALVRF
ncbi:putative porin [Agaribacterium sp. ZY112]|uniref:putative porin n=1 Tax=Agaribacterium sp. ZY112 TaxID=3233574 RepID=UPI003523622C